MSSSMASSGSGFGSSIGGSPTPTHRENETAAWTQINKAALGIVRDSIELVFTQANPLYTTGDIFSNAGYKASSGQPLLDHPLESTRLARMLSDTPNSGWQDYFAMLLDELPASLRARFEEQLTLPPSKRDYAFNILEDTLMATSRFFMSLDAASRPFPPDSLEAARQLLNFLLPIAALQSAVSAGSEYGEMVQNFVATMGANEVNFDALNAAVNDMRQGLYHMDQVRLSLGDSSGMELTTETKAVAAKASELFASANSQLEQAVQGGELSSLSATLNALSITSAALSLPHTGSAPLFLGLSLASIGLNSAESNSGLIGPSLQTVLDNAIGGIISSSMPKASPAEIQFLSMQVYASTALAIGVVSSVLNAYPPSSIASERAFAIPDITFIAAALGFLAPEISSSPEISGFWVTLIGSGALLATAILPALTASILADNRDPIRAFAVSTALRLLAGAEIAKEFFKESIAISGGNARAQELGAEVLAQATHLLMALSASHAIKKAPVQLFEEIEPYLKKGTEAAQSLVQEVSFDAETQMSQVAIAQLHNTLLEGDLENFEEALNSFLENQGLSLHALLNDLNALTTTTSSLLKIIEQRGESEALTGVVNIV